MRRVCLVGAGFISDAHAEAVRALPGARLEAVIDPNPAAAQRLAHKWGIPKTFQSVEEGIAADAFDCAHVLVPPDVHCRAALPLLRAGKAVFLEKPLAVSSAECGTLLAAESGNAKLGVNQNFVHHPAIARLRRTLELRTLGKPRFLGCVYNAPLRQLAAGQFGHWMFRAPGNLLLEQAVHPLSQLMALAGPIGDMEVLVGPAIELAPGVPFYSKLSVALQCQDVLAELQFAVGQSFPFWQLTAVCDDGVAVADILSNRSYLISRTRWSEGIDAFVSGHRTAGGMISDSWRNAADYGLATLRLKGRTSPFLTSVRASVAAFHSGIDTGIAPECDGRFGAALVAACEKIRDRLPVAAAKATEASLPKPSLSGADDSASVAVFGGTGFIGARVVDRLLRRGERVRVVARNLQNLPALYHSPNVTLFRADIASKQDVARAVGTAKTVINLAHGGASGSWEQIRAAMVGGAENVARACIESGADRLVHVGSIASLYLGRAADVITGATLPDPRSEARADYGRAKAECDRRLLEIHAREALPLTILRPGLVVGRGTSPFHSGIGFYNNEQHCIGWNSGRNPLPFVLVEDVADAVIETLWAENVVGQCFNLVGDVRPTAREYVSALARALERPLRFHGKTPAVLWSEEFMKWGIKRAAGRQARLPSYRDLLSRGLLASFDCSDAKNALNWQPVSNPQDFWKHAVDVHADP